MSNWGILSGLGEGLQQAGNQWTAQAKAKLADKLAQEREQRQADREVAKEERQAAAERAKVDTNASTVDLDPTTNSYSRTLRNSNYDVIGTAPVGTLEAEGIRTQREADQTELRTKSLDAQLKELNIGRLPTKWGQEDAMHRADLASESALQSQRYASAGASNRRGLDSAETTDSRSSASDARVLMDTYTDLVDEYTTPAEGGGRATLTQAQAEDVAQATIQRAVDNKLNPGQVAQAFRQALRITAERNKNAAPAARRGSSLSGN